MKKQFLILLFVLSMVALCAQSEDWLWAKQAGGTSGDYGQSIATDAEGNSYVTGQFAQTATFGSTTLSSGGSYSDVFVAKIDTNGNWLWAVRGGGLANESSSGIALDPNGGIYITGYFKGSSVFGGSSVTGYGGSDDIFVAKLDSNGNWLWARSAWGMNNNRGMGICVDTSGNCYITGSIQRDAYFGNTTLESTTNNQDDVFIAKLDTNGNWLWARSAGGYGNDRGTSVANDLTGCVYVTGTFSGLATFGSFSIGNQGTSGSFITKLDANGNWLWVKAGYHIQAYGISTDLNSNCYVTGSFNGTALLGSVELITNGSADVFVCSLDTNGNWLWATRAGGESDAKGCGIFTDNIGNSHIVGTYQDIASFGGTTLYYPSFYNIFIATLDVNGNWLWANRAGVSYQSGVYGISMNSVGDCFITGYFNETATFADITLNSTPGSDVFIAKLGDINYEMVYPNGLENWIAGTTQTISWQTNFNAAVDLYISSNGGVSWDLLNSEPLDANLRELAIVIPMINSNQCLIKVQNSQNETHFDISDSMFTIIILPPSVQFSVDVHNGLQPLHVQFMDQSIAGYGSVISWHWDFGNGDSSNEQHPLYIYQDPGLYSVSLTVSNSADFSSTLLMQDYIQVIARQPEIVVRPESNINFGNVYLDSSSLPYPLWIKNSGTADLSIESFVMGLASSPFQVQDPIFPMVIAVGDSCMLSLVYIPFAAGTISDSLYIYNNSINAPIYAIGLQGNGEYVPPKPPAALETMMDEDNMIITWDAVTETIFDSPIDPDYYLVFYNGSSDIDGQYYYLGRSWTLSYTHDGVALHAQHMFYRVRAYKYYGRDRLAWDNLGLETGMSETEVLEILRGMR